MLTEVSLGETVGIVLADQRVTKEEITELGHCAPYLSCNMRYSSIVLSENNIEMC